MISLEPLDESLILFVFTCYAPGTFDTYSTSV